MAYTYQSFATLGVNLNRQNYGALDISQVFNSQGDLNYYLSKGTDKSAVSDYWKDIVPYPYEGQIIATVFDGVVKVYVLALDTEGNFVTQNVGDTSAVEATIEALEAALTALDDKVGEIPTEEKDGEQVPVAKDIVEYINKKTEGIATDAALGELQTKVGNLETAVGNDEAGLVKQVVDLEDRADTIETTLADKANSSEVYTKTEVDTEIDNAVKGILGENVKEAYDTLKEIQDILEGTDGETIDGLIETVDANKQAIATLNGDDTVEGSVDKKIKAAIANKAEKATTLAGYGITDAYTKDEVYTKGEADQAIADKISEVNGGESAGEVLGQLNAYKKTINMEVFGNEAGTGDSRIDQLEAVGAQANVIEVIKVNGEVQDITDKTVNIEVPTDVLTSADRASLEGLISTAQDKADQAAETAATNAGAIETLDGTVGGHTEIIGQHTTAINNIQNSLAEGGAVGSKIKALEETVSTVQTTANEAKATSDSNKTDISGLKTTVGGHTTKIANLETFQIEHTALYDSLKGTVDGHTTAIAGKAEQTDLTSAVSRIAANETAIRELNNTVIPGINTNIDKKANADSVYTKEQIGTIADGKTIVEMINDAQTDATYDDTAIKKDIASNASAITTLVGSVEGDNGKSVRAIAIEEVTKVIDGAPAALDTLKEIADWINDDKAGAAKLAADVVANADAIQAINDEDTGIVAIAKAYTDAEINKVSATVSNLASATDTNTATLATLIGEDKDQSIRAIATSVANEAVAAIPEATAQAAGLVKASDEVTVTDGVLGIGQVSTDKLVQGKETLVLNGGSADSTNINS